MVEPQSKTLQEIGDEFHLMIGECITQWASVEEELFQICRTCLGCSLERAAIVYYRTPTIASRLDLINELLTTVLPQRKPRSAEHIIPDPDTKLWNQISKDLGDLLKTRNRLAHHPVTVRPSLLNKRCGRAASSATRIVICGLCQPTERTRKKSSDLKPLLLNDLKKHLASASIIHSRLHRFFYEELQRHLPESPQP
jgi:hypothetical protein